MTTPELEKLWDELLTKNPEPSTLMSVAREVPPLRDKAWEQLCSHRDTTTWNLIYLISSTPALRTKGWQEIKRRQPSHETLRQVVVNVPRIRDQAARMLLEQNPGENDLCEVISHCPQHRDRAWQALLPKNPHVHRYATIVQNTPALRQEAWEQFQQHEDAWRFYAHVVEHVEELREEAAQKLIEGKASTNDLCKVVEKVPQKAEAAGRKILDRTDPMPRVNSVLHVARHVEPLQEAAMAKVQAMCDTTTETLASCLGFLKGTVHERTATHVSENAGDNLSVLRALVEHGSTAEQRDQVGRKLLKIAPRDKHALIAIIKHCPSLGDDAWDLLVQLPNASSTVKAAAEKVPALQAKAAAWLREPHTIVNDMKQVAKQTRAGQQTTEQS